MKMNEVKSGTWAKVAEIKTDAKTPMDIYEVLCKEFDVDFYEDVFAVTAAILDGYIQICEDGIIVWGAWKEVDRHV